MSEKNNYKIQSDEYTILSYIDKLLDTNKDYNDKDFLKKELISYLNSNDRRKLFIEIIKKTSYPIEILSIFIKDCEILRNEELNNPIKSVIKMFTSSLIGTKYDDANRWQDIIANSNVILCIYKTKDGKSKVRFIDKNNVQKVAEEIYAEVGNKKDNIKISDINHASCAFTFECEKCYNNYKENEGVFNSNNEYDIKFISNICNYSYKDSSLEEAAREKYKILFPIIKRFNNNKQNVELELKSKCKSTHFTTSFINEINKGCQTKDLKINKLKTHFLEMSSEMIGWLNIFDDSTDKKNAKNIANVILNNEIEQPSFRFSLPSNQSEMLHTNATVFDTIEKVISYTFDNIRKTNNKTEKIKKLVKLQQSLKIDLKFIDKNDITQCSFYSQGLFFSEKKYKGFIDMCKNKKDAQYIVPDLFIPANEQQKQATENVVIAYKAAVNFLQSQAKKMEEFLSEQQITQEDIDNYLKEKEHREEDNMNKKTETEQRKSFIKNNNIKANTSLNGNLSNTLNM